jgi:hypothetical protein
VLELALATSELPRPRQPIQPNLHQTNTAAGQAVNTPTRACFLKDQLVAQSVVTRL